MAKGSKDYPVQIPPLPLRPGRAGMSRRTRTRLAYVLAGCIAAIVLTAVALAVFARGEALLPLGAAAPDFTLRTVAGTSVSLQGLRGKPALLVFCASWPRRCAVEVPALNRLARLPSSRVVFVNGDSEDARSVIAFFQTFHMSFPPALDPGPTNVKFPAHGPRGPVTGRYHVTAFPTFYVVDAQGRVAWRAAGEQSFVLLARELARAARPVP
jgi:peroxiredoxin